MRNNYWPAQQARREFAARDHHALVKLCDHEAGHAVVMHVLGCKLKRVFVARNDDFRWHGRCEHDGEVDARANIIILFAGPAADLHFHARELDPCGQDHRDAISAAEKITADEGGDMFAILDYCRTRAEDLVRRHADTIAVLSRALLAARWHEMSSDEVERVLTRADVPRGASSVHALTTRYFERRGGVTYQTTSPDPRRVTSVTMRRTDGFIA